MRQQNPSIREIFKKPKRKTYTLAGITALVVGFLIFFALRPTFIRISEMNKEIEDKKIFLEEIDSKLVTINDLIRQKQSIEKELVYFNEDFPIEKKSGFVVANFAEIASQFNILLTSVDFEEDLDREEGAEPDVEYPDFVKTVRVYLTFEGNVSDFEKYVEYLESFPRIFDIKILDYNNSELEEYEGAIGEVPPFKGNISMFIYYWNKEYDKDSIGNVMQSVENQDSATEEEEIIEGIE